MSPNSLLSDAERAAPTKAAAPARSSPAPKLLLAAVLLAAAASVYFLTRDKAPPVSDAVAAKQAEAERILRENGMAEDQQPQPAPTPPVEPRGRGPQAVP